MGGGVKAGQISSPCQTATICCRGGTDDGVTSRGQHYEVTPTGDVVWHEKYASGPSPKGYFFHSLQLPDGSIVSCGLTENTGTGGNAGWILKTTATGELLWQRVFDKNQYTDLFYSVLLAEDGGFLLSGQAWNEVTMSQDAWLLKVDSVGCTYVDCLVGVDENEPTKVVADVWPNPASQFINIEWQRQGEAAIMLLDMTGKQVLCQSGNGQRERIDVSELPNGLYVLHLVQGEVKTSLRVIIYH